jgi:hypothetical protein
MMMMLFMSCAVGRVVMEPCSRGVEVVHESRKQVDKVAMFLDSHYISRMQPAT